MVRCRWLQVARPQVLRRAARVAADFRNDRLVK